MKAHAHQTTKRIKRFLAAFKRGTKGINALSVGFYPSDPCKPCHGTGVVEDESCDPCNGQGGTNECRECPDNVDPEVGDEGEFTWSDCDTCNGKPGTRYAAHGLIGLKPRARRTHLIHLRSCQDCVLYIANGDLPDGED